MTYRGVFISRRFADCGNPRRESFHLIRFEDV
jgi:hypothetical protein